MKGIIFAAVGCVLLHLGAFQQSDKCKHFDADIVIVLDASVSIWIVHFRQQLDFVASFVDYVGVGTSGTQIAVVEFADYVKPIFNFNTYETGQKVRDAIKDIKHLNGRKTYTHAAIQWVRENAFLKKNGARDGVPHICIILTDGRSSEHELTVEQAALLKSTGVQIFGVGIGDRVSPEELRTISSQPADDFVILYPNFKALNDTNQLERLAYKTCEVKTTTPAPTTTTGIPEEIQKLCRGLRSDVVFVLDKSSSIGGNDFKKLLSFVKNMVKAFDVGLESTRIGVLTFSDEEEIYVEFLLDTFDNAHEIEREIDAIYYTGGGTNTAAALEVLVLDMFAYDLGARRGVPHIGIVITDGKSEDETATKTAAREAHKRGIKLISIGVGTGADMIELENIASDPAYVHKVENYDALDSIRNVLATDTCQVEIPQNDKRLCGSGDKEADILFSLDTSGIGGIELKQELDFITKVSETLDIEGGRVRCGMISNCPSNSEIYLNMSASRYDFQEQVTTFGKSSLERVMHRSHHTGFNKESGARLESKKIMVLFVSGPVDMAAVTEAARMKEDKIKIHVVSIGDVDKGLVDMIASDPPWDHTISVDTFDELEDVRSKLEERLCSQI